MPRLDRLATLYLCHPFMRLLVGKAKNRVPILMYHSISDNLFGKSHPYYQINASPKVFRRQMRWMRQNGYQTMNLTEMLAAMETGEDLSKKVVITFDDGYQDFYTDALPVLKQCGFKNVIELAEMEEIPFERGSITAVPFLGEHGDLNVLTKTAYLLRINDHTLMFAADSCNISPKLYEHVHKQIGDVEALFVGMECDGAPVSWIYGPLLTQRLERPKDLSRRLAGSNYDRALALVDQFHCKEVYVYAMGQEPWLNHVMSIKYTDKSNPIIHSDRLIETCSARGIKAERLFGEKEILLPYESHDPGTSTYQYWADDGI